MPYNLNACVANILVHDEYVTRPLWRFPLRWIVDVGANIGAFSTLAACRWPQASILAIEPHPEAISLLKYNTRFTNVWVAPYAITDEPCKVRICENHSPATLQPDPNPWNLAGGWVDRVWNQLERAPEAIGIEVEGETLPNLLDREKFPRIDLLKIDCEGGEYVALEQLRAADRLKDTYWIRGEWHHRDSNDRILAALQDTHEVHIDPNHPHHVGFFIAHNRTPWTPWYVPG